MWDDYFKGKKVTLMGLGLLGRGIGDARFLARHGAELLVTDLKTREQLAASLDALKDFPNITYRLGEHVLDDFRGRDMVIKGAGVPLDSPFIAEARTHGVPIEMSTALFARLLAGYKKSVGKDEERYLVGVTGTKGKTTTTHLIFEMLKQGKPGARVRMGGNIQGVSTLEYLDDLQPDDLFVLELDSWQLQGFGESKMSPQVAVFVNFFSDHLNYYKGDMDRYFEDKMHIFLHQRADDICFAGPTVIPWATAHAPERASRLIVPSVEHWTDASRSLQGAHNDENIALASSVARTLGVDEDTIASVIRGFEGVPGRLQFVKEKDGISYYNDTAATVPDAVRAAIHALGAERRVILIMGGADKQIDATPLVDELSRYCKALVLFKGTGTDTIRARIVDGDFESVREASSMHEAVEQARSVAVAGDIILLSPGFASFGMFTNEYDRGDQFMEEIRSL